MQVILTPTAVADKFGAGLNGFAGSVPGPPTQLSEQWFDSVQMEIVNVILGQGIALDGLVFDQLKQAIDDYSFVDPTISGSLTIDGGATLFVANTALLRVQSGAAVVLENGSTFAVEGNVTLIASNNTWVWGSSNANDWTINGNVTLGTGGGNAVVTIGADASDTLNVPAQSVFNELATFGPVDAVDLNAIGDVNLGTGVGDKTVTIGVSAADILALNASVDFAVATPATTNGRLVYNNRRFSVGSGATARRIHSPQTVYVVSDTTNASLASISGANLVITITPDEWVYVRISAIQESDTAVEDVKLLIAGANGVDSIAILNGGDGDQAQLVLPTVVTAADRAPTGFTVRWKPSNDVAVPANNVWTIIAQHGITGGAATNVTSRNVFLEVWYE
jgi:hypothetical protein